MLSACNASQIELLKKAVFYEIKSQPANRLGLTHSESIEVLNQYGIIHQIIYLHFIERCDSVEQRLCKNKTEMQNVLK